MKHTRILTWVNRIRREHFGKGPIKRLPRGKIGRTRCCPIHNCFWPANSGGSVGRTAVWSSNDEIMFDIPSQVTGFIIDFDSGKYPELVKK